MTRVAPIPWLLLAILSAPVLLAGQADSTSGASVLRAAAGTRIDPQPLGAPPTLTELLGGKSPALTVYRSNGLPGVGGFLRTRGVHSFVLSADPILEVDGLVVPLSTTRFDRIGGESLLDLIDPEDVESIEIVPGLASSLGAAAGAVNGVVRVTTRRGRAGPTRWRWSSEVGVAADPADYGTVYWGFDPSQPNRSCDLSREAVGACHISQVLTRRPADDPAISLLRTSLRRKTGLLVSGMAGRARYAVSGRLVDETGVLDLPESERALLRQKLATNSLPGDRTTPSRLTSMGIRANLDIDLTSRLQVHVSSALSRQSPRLPVLQERGASWIYESMLLASAVPGVDSLPFGYPWSHSAERFDYATDRRTTEWHASGRLDWVPLPALSVWTIGGIERATVLDVASFTDWFPTVAGREHHDTTSSREPATQVSAGTRWTRRVDGLTFATTAMGQFRRRAPSLAYAYRTGLGDGQYGSGGSTGSSGRTISFLAREDVTIGARTSVFVIVRQDQTRLGGQKTGGGTSESLGGSARISGAGAPIQFHLRANAASVGRSLGADDGRYVGVFPFGALAQERVREVEVGTDLALRNGQVAVALTWFDQRLSNGLGAFLNVVPVVVAGNNATRATGFEAEVMVRPIDHAGRRLTVTFNATARSDRVEALAGPLLDNAARCASPGSAPYPVCGGRIGDVTDRDGNGVITPDELPPLQGLKALAPSLPTKLASLRATFEWPGLGGTWEFSGQLDYAGGFRSSDNLEALRCEVSICRALTTKGSTLQDQARGFLLDGYAYSADASFARVRELTMAYRSPWRIFGSNGLILSLAGRNLATITKFPGLDPEVRVTGESVPASIFQPPIQRSVALRIAVDW